MTPNEESGYALLAAFEDRMARRDNADEWRMRLCGMGARADAEKAQRLAAGGIVEAERQRVVVSKTETTTVGNAAAMRNALIKVRTYLLRSPYAVDEDGVMADVVDALAAPVRNCDRFNSVLEAAKAFAAEYQKQPHPCPDFIFSRWLLATAAERKGDGNGR